MVRCPTNTTGTAICTQVVHELLAGLGDYADVGEALEALIDAFPSLPSGVLEPGTGEQMFQSFQKHLERELEPAPHLANFIGQRLRPLVRPGECATYEQLLGRTAQAYAELARAWSPVYMGFVKYVLGWSARLGLCPTMLARDAIPFFMIGSELVRHSPWAPPVKLFDLSRPLMKNISEPSVRTYVRSHLDPRRDLMVDCGVYGTFLVGLHQAGVGVPATILFYTRNPFVDGYLNSCIKNSLLADQPHPAKARLDVGIQAVDTIESWPKPYYAADQLDERGNVVSKLADPVTLAGSIGFYWRLARDGRENTLAPVHPEGCQNWLERLCDQVQSHVELLPYLLPEAIPKDQKSIEMAKHWSLGHIPPMDEIAGPTPG